MAALRVLLVEDSEDDATLILRELRHAGYELVVVERVATADGLRGALARQAWDLVTCDDTLSELSALAALTLIRAHDGNVPIVVVSGQVGEEHAAGLIRAGADDLVLKHNVRRLAKAVEQAVRDATNRRRLASAQAATDVTALEMTEQALREARASLEVAATAARVGLWDWDLQTAETHYADSWRTLFGYTPAEFDGSMEAWSKIVHPDDLERLAGSSSAATAIADPAAHYEEEFQLRRKDGTYRWVLSRATVLRDAAGNPQRMVGAHVDITERKQAEDAARRNARQIQAIMEASIDNIAIVEADGTFREISPSIRVLLGYEVSELLGRNAFDLVHPDDRAAVQADFASRVAQPELGVAIREFRLHRADGSWVSVESTLNNRLSDPAVRGLVITTRDITERKQALAARLLDVREAESARIAREIHDLLGQGLTALRMDAAWLETRLSSRRNGCPDQPVLKRLRAMAGLIEANIASVRRIATELRPPILDDLGLVPTIEWQAEEFEARSGIRCEFRAWPGIPALDPNRSIVVLRVLQEALTNVARHAGATRVVIHVSAEHGFLCLEVRDNGRGIREHQINATRALGLRSMGERAALVGGTVAIKGAPGRGTTVTLRVPEGQSTPLPVPTPGEGARGSGDRSGAE
ncbi:MAG TPA: PAS domain S-box protein [Candidatus Acidoferrales bacterium]|nr:PAS domain S-box protein [Candidatus Acidoferrales bacterium]